MEYIVKLSENRYKTRPRKVPRSESHLQPMLVRTTSFHISDQMQNAHKEAVLSIWLANVDNGGTLEPVLVEAP